MTVENATNRGIAESMQAELITASYQKDKYPKCYVGIAKGRVLVLLSAGAQIYGEDIESHAEFIL